MLIWVQRAQYKTNSRGDAVEALLADPGAADAVREAGQALTANVGLLVTLLDWMLGTAILVTPWQGVHHVAWYIQACK